MKILIITSIEKGGIGGPSLYADKLPKALADCGLHADVLRRRHLPKAFRELLYFFELLWMTPQYNILYSLSGSPGINIPALICAKFFRKKFCMRPGGDFLWERAVEHGETEKTPRGYYKGGEHKKQKFSFSLFRGTLWHINKIIFPTSYLRSLYQEYFFVPDEKCAYVDYPFPGTQGGLGSKRESRQFVFAGRLIKFKNGARLIRAFAAIENRAGATLKIIGEGPEKAGLMRLAKELGAESYIFFEKSMDHATLLNELSDSYCVVIPSIFEPGSFFMLECLKFKVPVIFTRESGLYDAYAGTLLFVDPYSIADIKNKIEWLFEGDNYNTYMRRIEGVNTQRCWGDVAREHKMIFEKL
jgi:glycosyltransferase involved in cell wall biosynthesis